MPTSIRRRDRRLLLGANRKSRAVWWIGCRVVEIRVSACNRVKAHKGAEKSCHPRRSRKGQRCGKRGSREGKSRSSPPAARTDKNVSARRVNHSGRKFLWAVRTAPRIFARTDMQSLELAARPYFGGAKWLDKRLTGTPLWRHCRNVLSGFRARAKALGIPPPAAFEVDLWTFIQVHSRFGGDMMSLLEHAELGPFSPDNEPKPVNQFIRRGGRHLAICRLCGKTHDYNERCAKTPTNRLVVGRKKTLPMRGSRGGKS